MTAYNICCKAKLGVEAGLFLQCHDVEPFCIITLSLGLLVTLNYPVLSLVELSTKRIVSMLMWKDINHIYDKQDFYVTNE